MESEKPEWARLILEAKESVDLLVFSGASVERAFEVLGRHPRPSLRLRCIMTAPSSFMDERRLAEYGHWIGDVYEERVKRFVDHGWQVRMVKRSPSVSCAIIDQKRMYLNYGAAVNTEPAVESIQDHFERLWSEHRDFPLIYENLLASTIPEASDKIVAVSQRRWAAVIEYLAREPEKLRHLSPRDFEELVAELLVREGMEVELTRPSNDGGRDIIARADTPIGFHLYFVECKRYGPQNPVGVALVRALYGVVEMHRATSGLLVTTSHFTRGAIAFQRAVEHRLALRDYDGLRYWLSRLN